MSDPAGGKQKKSKKHSDESASHESSASSAPSTHSGNLVAGATPQIVVQGSESSDNGGKSRRGSKNTLTVASAKSEEKVKEKSKDKERRKMSKEASHSSQTTPVQQTTESPIIHEAELWKYAGRIKGTLTMLDCIQTAKRVEISGQKNVDMMIESR